MAAAMFLACNSRASPIKTEAVDGDCVSCVLELAERIKADLGVVGSHGRSGVSRAFLGSVAEGLLRWSQIPVLVTHGPPKPAG